MFSSRRVERHWRRRNPNYMCEWRKRHPGYAAAWMRRFRGRDPLPHGRPRLERPDPPVRLEGRRVKLLGVAVIPNVLQILNRKETTA
jgi:hypothetical protein